MKLITALLAAVLLVAGCSGSSSDEPSPSDDASRQLDREALEKQAESQSKNMEKAQKDLEKAVTDEANRAAIGIQIKDGKATPQGKRIEVQAGDPVTLSITSDADEEIHVHSDPEHTFTVKAGTPLTETFTIDTPGQVAVEAHELGVTIVQLVVRK